MLSLTHMFDSMPTLLALFGLPGGMEMIVLLVLGLLIFGRRLPEVGRSLGRGIVEFKRGIRGLEDDVEEESARTPEKRSLPEDGDQQGQPLPQQFTSEGVRRERETVKPDEA